MRNILSSAAALTLAVFSLRCATTGGSAPGATPAAPAPPPPSARLSADFLAALDGGLASIPAGSYSATVPGVKETHRVAAFRLGRDEVTQRVWTEVMGSNPSAVRGGDLPVTNVSFLDVKRFLDRLNASAGGPVYRLPTRVEWEYACHARHPGKYPWGNDPKAIGRYAWWSANSGEQPHPVGQKPANAWGLHDMIGNASEWTSDVMEGNLRFIEGGSYEEPNDSGLWCENRAGLGEDGSEDATGFRLARDAKPQGARPAR